MNQYFNYKIEAERLILQVPDKLPDTLNQQQRNFIIETIREYSYKAGEALVVLINVLEIDYTPEQYQFSLQLFTEWIFHKTIDLTLSGLPQKYCENILEETAFIIFETLKKGIRKNLENEKILQAVEYHVHKVYANEIRKLYKKNSISEETYENALKQSNIDIMSNCEKIDYRAFFETKNTFKSKNTAQESGSKPFIFCCILMCIYRIIRDINYVIINGDFMANILVFVEIALLTSISILLLKTLFQK